MAKGKIFCSRIRKVLLQKLLLQLDIERHGDHLAKLPVSHKFC